MRTLGKKEGIVRVHAEDGTVAEGCWLGDVKHGLVRVIKNDTVSIEFWVNNEKLSWFKFDDNFVEIARKNDHLKFGKLYAHQFSKHKNDAQMLENML